MTPRQNYWLESLQSSADEHGVKMTKEQEIAIAKDLETSHDCYGMAFGHDCIPNPMSAELKEEKAKRDIAISELERQKDALKKSIAARYDVPVWVSVGRNGEVTVERQR